MSDESSVNRADDLLSYGVDMALIWRYDIWLRIHGTFCVGNFHRICPTGRSPTSMAALSTLCGVAYSLGYADTIVPISQW
jgi:hypothetical protein